MNSIECPYCGKSDAVSNTLDLGEGEHKVECIACQIYANPILSGVDAVLTAMKLKRVKNFLLAQRFLNT